MPTLKPRRKLRTIMRGTTGVRREDLLPRKRTQEVNYGTRDIDPRPISIIKEYLSQLIVCSRCQERFRGIRAMGAYMQNKFVRHTLLPFVHYIFSLLYYIKLKSELGPMLSFIIDVTLNKGSWDIDPGPLYIFITSYRHTLLPLNVLHLLASSRFPGHNGSVSRQRTNGKLNH